MREPEYMIEKYTLRNVCKNWRLISEGERNKVKGIYLVSDGMGLHFFYNATIESCFEYLQKENEYIINYPTKYIRNVDYCKTCAATGLVDWIEKATGSVSPTRSLRKKFFIPDNRVNLIELVVQGFANPVILRRQARGSEYSFCEKCYGSGLHIKPALTTFIREFRLRDHYKEKK